LRPNPQTLGVVPLEKGEASRPIRIRGKKTLFERLREYSPKEIGELLELGLIEKLAQTARNARSRHYILEEARALIDRKVRVLQSNGQQRSGRTITIHAMHQVRIGEGFELELNDGIVVSRRTLLSGVQYQLIDA
jgi:hypothetical protein